ncbi:hypothetical protein HS7_04030 [Sulfolobales archaeon HS-7]|nr:hypothetical protein HS7_04030 [Sulfolobales archaeon HS-7]
MNFQRRLFILVIIVALAIGVGYALIYASIEMNSNEGETVTSGGTAYVEVYVNSTVTSTSVPILLKAALVNPSRHFLKVRLNDSNLLGRAPCNNYIPIGIVMYRGIVALSNVSNATMLPLYPPIVFCPFEFPVLNETLLPHSCLLNVTYKGLNGIAYKVINASLNVVIKGYYTIPGDKLNPLSPGFYTIEVSTPLTSPVFVYIHVE